MNPFDFLACLDGAGGGAVYEHLLMSHVYETVDILLSPTPQSSWLYDNTGSLNERGSV